MRSRTLISLLTVIFLVLLVAATLTTRVTKASPGTLYVSTDGVCAGNLPCYSSLQEALDAADPFDEICVATGTYTDPAGTVAEITETITLQGGWNTGFSTQDPSTYPTTLDAQSLGRVVEISGSISPTIDGFIITGGNATEFTGSGLGGGIYSWNADPFIANNVITNNIASTSTVYLGFGGGICLQGASASAVVTGNLILSNTASTGFQSKGGGLYLGSSDATISGNTVQDNKASTADVGNGGGLYLSSSDATLSGNTISDNTASTTVGGSGGGLCLYDSKATLDGNSIISNTAYEGGGLLVAASALTLTNNIIAQNQADGMSGGIYSWGSSVVLINNTIAQNNLGSDGQGVFASGDTTLTLTNNIIVSHTYGIYAAGGATVTADYTLFFDNTIGDTYGTITNTNAITDTDPLFVDPSGWDYHIQVASPAVNSGTLTGAPSTDFEGDPRPYDCFIDIGADENTASDECKRIYLPLIMKNY